MYNVDCLTNGAPHPEEANAVTRFFGDLDEGPHLDAVRIQFVIQVFARMLKLRHSKYTMEDYFSLLNKELTAAKERTKNIERFSDMLDTENTKNEKRSLVDATADHYAEMFSYFSEDDFFVISPNNLKSLFQVNGFHHESAETKRALDAGCGSGRYSYALHAMGFGHVTGIDYSPQNIAFATKMIESRSLHGIDFKVADICKPPFNNEFDFKFSNGVLHYVDAPYKKTLKELHRVLKKGGTGCLYIMEKLGEILHDSIEICRRIIKKVPEQKTISTMRLMGFSGYRIYAVLDHICAPINRRVTQIEFENILEKIGFNNIRRFQSGLASGDIENLI